MDVGVTQVKEERQAKGVVLKTLYISKEPGVGRKKTHLESFQISPKFYLEVTSLSLKSREANKLPKAARRRRQPGIYVRVVVLCCKIITCVGVIHECLAFDVES